MLPAQNYRLELLVRLAGLAFRQCAALSVGVSTCKICEMIRKMNMSLHALHAIAYPFQGFLA